MMSLRARLGAARRNRLLRDTSMLYSATVVAGVLQYGALIILARELGPGPLAAIVLATTIGGLLPATAEFGIGAVLIRYYAPLHESRPELWQALSRFLLVIVGAVVVGIATIGVAVAALLGLFDASFTIRESIGYGFALASLTVLLSYFQNFFQAQRRFAMASATVALLPLLRVGALAGLAAAGAVTSSHALAVYVGALALVVVWGWLQLPGPRVPRRADAATRRRARELGLAYIKWTALGRAVVAFNGNIGILALTALGTPTTTGLYAAAWQTAAPLPMLGSVIEIVAFPHLVAHGRRHVDREMFRRLATWFPLALGVGALCAALAPVVLPAVLGQSFEGSVLPFQLIAVAMALQVWLAPVGAMLYAGDRQRFAAFMAVGQLVTLVLINVLLIPSIGATAPAVAIMATTVATIPLNLFAVRREAPRPAALAQAEQRDPMPAA